MNKTLLFILMLISLSVFGQETDVPKVSPEHLKLRNELENDESIVAIGCGLYTAIDPTNPEAKRELEIQKEAMKVRQKLFDASRNNSEAIKAKASCGTDEGSTVVTYLLVEKGKIKFIRDFSRDPWGGFTIISYDCEKLELGYFVENKEKMRLDFIPFADGENTGDKISFLQCRNENQKLYF